MASDNDILKTVKADAPQLSRAFRQIAEFLIADPRGFIQRPLRDLSETIGVSEPSLIRFSRNYGFKGVPDMRLAIAMGLAALDAGGSAEFEPAISDKEVVNRRAKRAVAARAAELIASDSSILLDSGSTVQFLAPHLREAKPLSIMTTGLNLLLSLQGCQQHQLILTGGTLRQNSMSLSGRLVENSLEGMSFDTVYLGADRIDPTFGLSTFSEEEAHLNRAMLRASRRVVVLTDASKFGATKLHRICGLSEVDVIVSDDTMPDATRDEIRAQGVELLLATPEAQQDNSKE